MLIHKKPNEFTNGNKFNAFILLFLQNSTGETRKYWNRGSWNLTLEKCIFFKKKHQKYANFSRPFNFPEIFYFYFENE